MWWNDRQRFDKEMLEMARLPNYRFLWNDSAGGSNGCWVGVQPGELTGTRYSVEIRYTDQFPWAPPAAFILDPRVLVSPHRFADGSLCLFDRTSAWRFLSAQAIATQVALWIFCQETWELTGGHAKYLSTGSIRDTFDFWPAPQERH